MNETKFNAELRGVMRVQGLGVLHIREADLPGAADLIVTKGLRFNVWVELKVDDHEVEGHQWQFLANTVLLGGRAFVVRLRQGLLRRPYRVEVVQVLGHKHTVDLGHYDDFHNVSWPELFEQ